jgi:hypothetical protein
MAAVPVTVRPVSSPEDLQSFIEIPYGLHRDETHWIFALAERANPAGHERSVLRAAGG